MKARLWFAVTFFTVIGGVLCAWAGDRAHETEVLAKTEREFSAESERNGMFRAFTTYFAPDGFHLNPIPVAVKDDFSREMKQASDFTLSWRPAVNDVAAAADLGYSSGPWTITDKSKAGRPPVYGTFLSIWRKQSNGKWRVIVDMGVRVRTPTDEHGQQKWNASTLPAIAMQGAEPTKEAWSLLELDRQFSDEAGTAGLAASYRTYAFSDARILRENIGALSSVENREKVLTTEDSSGKYAWLPLRSEVSSSADFGYTFGSYIVTPTDEAKPSAKGYYARVWRRDASRAWKVVAETLKEQPAPKN